MTTRAFSAGLGGSLAFVLLAVCATCTPEGLNFDLSGMAKGGASGTGTPNAGGGGRKGSGGTRNQGGSAGNVWDKEGGNTGGGGTIDKGQAGGGSTDQGAAGKDGTGGKAEGTGGKAGSADGGAAGGQSHLVGDVAFTAPSQSFKGSIAVGMTTPLSGAEIRYTTDGTLPTASSTLYSGTAVTLESTTQLRAQAFVDGSASGSVSTGIYLARTVDLTSDVPIIVVDGYGSGKACDKEVTLDAAVMIWEPVDGVASMTSLPTFATRAGYHARGQSSITFPQLSYKIELWDNANEDFDYALLGMPADSDWALIAPYYDRSLIRNPFIYTLGKDMGMEAPRTQYAEVYINYASHPIGDADYQGIYWVSELIKNNKVRTNLKSLKEADTELPKITGGYIMKFDQMAAEEPKLTCTGSNPLPGMTFGAIGGGAMGGGAADAGIWGGGAWGGGAMGGAVGGGAWGGGAPAATSGCTMKMAPFAPTTGQAGTCWTDLELVDPKKPNEQQKAWITGYIQQLHDSLHKSPIGDYSAHIDVPTFIDYMILSELSLNVDAYTKSAYYFKDRDGKLKAGPLWDYNFALGGVGAMSATPQSTAETGWRYNGNRNINDWYPKLATDPNFMAQVQQRYLELRKTLLTESAIDERINRLSAPLKKAVARDFAKWPVSSVITSTTGFYGGPTVATWDGQVKVVRDFLVARLKWIDSHWM